MALSHRKELARTPQVCPAGASAPAAPGTPWIPRTGGLTDLTQATCGSNFAAVPQ